MCVKIISPDKRWLLWRWENGEDAMEMSFPRAHRMLFLFLSAPSSHHNQFVFPLASFPAFSPERSLRRQQTSDWLSPSDLSINKERRCMEMESRKIGSTEVVVEGHSGGKISISKENFSELLLRGKLQSRNSARFFRRLSVRGIHCWCMNNFRFRINVVFDADFADIQILWISKTLSLTSIHSTFLATGFQNHSTFCTLTIAKMPLTAYL